MHMCRLCIGMHDEGIYVGPTDERMDAQMD